jgi:trk system potassium uptake protein TrkA
VTAAPTPASNDLHVIIAGAGRVGHRTARVLEDRGHEVYLIDEDPEVVEDARQTLQSTVIDGDATEPNVLAQADPRRADVLAALTETGSTNFAICAVVKHLTDDLRTIARIERPDQLDEERTFFDRVVYPYAPRSYAYYKQTTYGPYRNLALVAGSVAFLAIFIVCLGLAALAAYIAQTRVKEIGVRKALGASEWSVVRRLTANYAWLVVGTAGVGLPLAWWLSARLWQPLFSSALDPNAGILVGSVSALGALVLMVVGWQVWRAARISPVEALRDE